MSSPVEVHLRRALAGDVCPAAEVYLRSRHAAVPAIPALVHEDDEVRAWFEHSLFPSQELWIAESASGSLVGLMALEGDLLSQLYVDPGWLKRGVGSQLLALAKSLRPEGLELWTFQSNHGARRFYERNGFAAVQYRDGADNEEGASDVRYVWKAR